MTLILFLSLPVLLPLCGAFWLVRRKRYTGLLQAALLGGAMAAIGLWSVFQSRSSTGALGLLPLPIMVTAVSVLCWAAAQGRMSPRRHIRVLGHLALLAALAIPAIYAIGGLKTRARYQAFDQEQRLQAATIDAHRLSIKSQLAQEPTRRSEMLDALAKANASDRLYLLALLNQPDVPAPTLEFLAQAAETSGLSLSILRQKNASSELISSMYHKAGYKDYYFADLAAHPNTPVEILTEIYKGPRTIQYLDRNFASNPALPLALKIDMLSRTTDVNVVQAALGVQPFDCKLLPLLGSALARSDRPRDDFSVRRIAELQAGDCRP